MESEAHTTDKHFFDLFMVIIGILIGVTFGLFILANYIAGQTQEVYVLQDKPFQEENRWGEALYQHCMRAYMIIKELQTRKEEVRERLARDLRH